MSRRRLAPDHCRSHRHVCRSPRLHSAPLPPVQRDSKRGGEQPRRRFMILLGHKEASPRRCRTSVSPLSLVVWQPCVCPDSSPPPPPPPSFSLHPHVLFHGRYGLFLRISSPGKHVARLPGRRVRSCALVLFLKFIFIIHISSGRLLSRLRPRRYLGVKEENQKNKRGITAGD